MSREVPFDLICREVRAGLRRVVVNSGEAHSGCVFVHLPAAAPSGRTPVPAGGEQYTAQALAAGAGVIVCAPEHKDLVSAALKSFPEALFAVVPSTRAALGLLARAEYKTDTRCPAIVGITGTNGKTTESYLLEALFTAAGHRVGVIGTVTYRWPGHIEDAPLTTPGCLALHSLLARMADAGVDIVFMEVSSHALDQERVAGLNFSGALITNMTQDHLDYHPSMEHYFAAKSRLFLPVAQGGVPLDGKKCVVNADDAYCRRLLKMLPQAVGFGLGGEGAREPYLAGSVVEHTPAGLCLDIRYGERSWQARSPLVGLFNASNLLGAWAMGLTFDLPDEAFTHLTEFSGVPGRLQRVPNSKGVNAFVDYAHTPDALFNVLRTLHEVGFDRIITVFGCGGNRDASKRPLMGEVAGRLSHVAIVTSDNPRFEDPEAIIADIVPGLAGCANMVVEPNRRRAIRKGLDMLGPHDALLIAGKGHETYQIIQGKKYDFNDMAVVQEYVECD